MYTTIRRIGVASLAGILCGFLAAQVAQAKVATCDDIATAQGLGLSSEAIRAELNTTAARIENCARLAKMDQQQKQRRSAARARRSARLGSVQ